MKRLTKFLMICALAILLVPAHNYANEAAPLSDDEKIVFAFLKLSKQNNPDFTDWIKQGRLYKRTDQLLKSDVLEQENARLSAAFKSYEAATTPLHIKTEILLKTGTDGGKQTLSFSFPDGRDLELPYFPYKYGDVDIAFIIDDLKNHLKTMPSADQTALIKKHFLNDAPYEGTLEVTLRPLSADITTPLPIGNKNYALLIGDIAHLELRYYDKYEHEDLVFWDYTAPWYAAPQTPDTKETDEQ